MRVTIDIIAFKTTPSGRPSRTFGFTTDLSIYSRRRNRNLASTVIVANQPIDLVIAVGTTGGNSTRSDRIQAFDVVATRTKHHGKIKIALMGIGVFDQRQSFWFIFTTQRVGSGPIHIDVDCTQHIPTKVVYIEQLVGL